MLAISASGNLGNGSATNTIAISGGTLDSTANTYNLGVSRTIALGGPGTIEVDGGTLTVSGSVNNGGNLLTVQGAGSASFSGAITGGGGLTKAGPAR